LENSKILKIRFNETLLILGKIFLSTLLVAVIFSLRIPMAFRTLWAEDGNVHLAEALNSKFPLEIFRDNYGGYWNVTSRLIARLVALSPIELFTYVNFFLICAVTGLVVFVIYDTTETFIQSRSLRIILSLSAPMLPIARFDVIATSVNLHFYLLFASLLIIISTSRNNHFKVHHIITIILGTLSDPLTIFCVFVLLPIINLKNKRFQIPKYSKSSKLFLVLMLIHSTFTLLQLKDQLQLRQPEADHSVLKTGYLFLDRVLGSAFIPSWGEVSSADFDGQNFSSSLLLRLLVSISLAIFWFCVMILVWRVASIKKENYQIHVMIYLFISGICYWTFSGTVFNPEPRYAVFPALCLLTISTILVDQNLGIKKPTIAIPVFSLLLISTWIFSWAPTDFRTSGTTWENQLIDARKYCEKEEGDTFNFVTMPYNWEFTITCNKIIGK